MKTLVIIGNGFDLNNQLKTSYSDFAESVQGDVISEKYSYILPLDLNEDIISVVYEKPGSLKIGNYLPGTHIPIQSDDDLFALADKSLPIINFAWHIPNEIRVF